jgi:flavin-binding protein dodecin
MSVAKVIEINSSSPDGFDDAIRRGIAKASETVRNIKGAWVHEQTVAIEDGSISEFRVNLRVSFLLD